jgi:tight adherence protein C
MGGFLSSNEVLASSICLACGAAAGLLAWSLYATHQQIASQVSLTEDRLARISSLPFKVLVPFTRPFAVIFAGLAERAMEREAMTGNRSVLVIVRSRLRAELIAAGSPQGITPDEFMGLLVVCGLMGLGAGLPTGMMASASIHPSLGISIGTLLVLLGLAWPVLWLRGQLKYRKLSIRKTLPYALDLLTLSVEAGLDFTQSLARICRKLGRVPLAEEFAEMLRQIQMGRSRTDALRDMGGRCEVEELSSVVSSLVQADELGASLGPILRIQSEQLRVRRGQRAERLAMLAPVKLLLPLIGFIFPTIFLMIFGTLIVKFYYSNPIG